MTVVCERGTLRADYANQRWSWMTDPNGTWNHEPVSVPERDTIYQIQNAAFLDASRASVRSSARSRTHPHPPRQPRLAPKRRRIGLGEHPDMSTERTVFPTLRSPRQDRTHQRRRRWLGSRCPELSPRPEPMSSRRAATRPRPPNAPPPCPPAPDKPISASPSTTSTRPRSKAASPTPFSRAPHRHPRQQRERRERIGSHHRDRDEFNRSLANATGYFLLARKLHDHAVARGGTASIVMIGSMYGVVGSYPEPTRESSRRVPSPITR